MSGPFFSPWDILKELPPILRALYDEFPNYVSEEPSNSGNMVSRIHPTMEPIQLWWDLIQRCSWKLPHVHEGIVKQQKISQGGGCCGISDLCELLFKIESARPATKEKVEDETWRDFYLNEIHEVLCCIQNVEIGDNIKGINTFPHITEIPPFDVDGLPGFRYPVHRIPPITRLIRPNSYRLTNPPEPGSATQDNQAPNKGRDHEKEPFLAYNVDGKSRVMGVYNTIGDRLVSTPFESQKSILVDAEGTQVDFKVDQPPPFQVPNINVKPHRTVELDESVSQFIPAPMFMPVNTISSLTLGDGEEFGVYSNFTVGENNFGTQFKVDTNVIAPLVKSSPFERKALPQIPGMIGVDRSKPLY